MYLYKSLLGAMSLTEMMLGTYCLPRGVKANKVSWCFPPQYHLYHQNLDLPTEVCVSFLVEYP